MAPPPYDRPKAGPAYELLLDMGPNQGVNEPLLPVHGQDRVRRKTSASGNGPDKRSGVEKRVAGGPPVPARVAQPPGLARQKDKFVPLPSGLASSGDLYEGESGEEGGETWIDQAIGAPVEAPDKSRVTAHCLAESFDRVRLEQLLQDLYVSQGLGYTTQYPDVVHLALSQQPVPVPLPQPLDSTGPTNLISASPAGANTNNHDASNHDIHNNSSQHSTNTKRKVAPQDAFFFNYGVLITYGMDKQLVADLLKQVAYPVQVKPYSASEREVDEFQVQESATEPPHIKNDTFTINKRQAKVHTVRLSIAYALAQSSKLSVYEEQVWDLVEATKHLPEIMAQTGKVAVSPKTVTRLIGKVFLQAANVNLVSSVLDTPPYFWSAPDALQALYERACEYLELEARVEVLNTRFQVLQELLDMLRNQQNNYHASRLEVIIIWLLVVDCVLMLFQLLSLFGVVGQ